MFNFLSKNKKWLVPVVVIALLAIMFVTMFTVAKEDSGTTDEVAHIPAGYTYDKAQDYRLNPEHPPLAKVIAGLPLLFLNLKGPFSDWSWQAANQWEAGWNFIYEQGNSADQILIYARTPMMILTLLLGLIIFFWARSLYGNKVALIILLLFSFSPNFIAHGHLVTTDIAATLGFVIGVWGFVNFLEKKTWGSLILAAALFGIAQSLKFSSILLIPMFFLILIAKVILERKEIPWLENFGRLFGKSLVGLIFGFIVVWAIYTPFVWKMPAAVEHKVIEENLSPNDPRSLPLRNALHKLEGNRLTRPIGHYILGVSYIFSRTAGGNATFIIGYFSDKGISWYFPVAWLLKAPLPITFLLLYGIILLITRGIRGPTDAWRLWYFFIPVAIYWAITLKGSLNIGIRHLLPTMPFIYLFIGRTIYPIFNPVKSDAVGIRRDELFNRVNSKIEETNSFRLKLQRIVLVVLILWFVIGSIITYPSYLAYFNELTWGRPKNQFLVDSNLDWGQDLKRLAEYVNEHPEIDKLRIDYFGGGVPAYYIEPSRLIDWHSDQGPRTGWFAISSTFFQFSKMYGVMEGKWDYSWLESHEPVKVIGNSILVYYITPMDLKEFPPTHLAPEIKVSPREAEAERRGDYTAPQDADTNTPSIQGTQTQSQGVSNYLEKTRR
ncbi:glycosyltransferase family 39 protein [Patescibacteria group bacterium]|nr:glycosyltransferase family 39 protein [Patescibacteria group bacterium]